MNDTAALSVVDPSFDPLSGAERGGDLVLFDLEFTAWDGSLARNWSEAWEHREVIQIGAVRVRDDPAFTETGRFLCYVSPAANPELSDYIVALTGIDQRTVDEEGFEFGDALDVFLDFCDGVRAVLSYDGDPDVLAENCRLNKIAPPSWSRFGEISPFLGRKAGPEFATSSSFMLPTLVGLKPDGRAHDALDDSLALAATLRELRRRGTV